MRKIFVGIFLGSVSLLLNQIAMACDCLYWGKFSDYVADGSAVRARILSYGERLTHGETLYASMTVEVIDVVKGEYANQSITFWGDPGHLCRDYVDSEKFGIGDEFLFSINGDNQDQALGGCGESSVKIVKNKVVGADWVDYKPIPYEVEYEEFIKLINSPRDILPPKKQILSSSQ